MAAAYVALFSAYQPHLGKAVILTRHFDFSAPGQRHHRPALIFGYIQHCAEGSYDPHYCAVIPRDSKMPFLYPAFIAVFRAYLGKAVASLQHIGFLSVEYLVVQLSNRRL